MRIFVVSSEDSGVVTIVTAFISQRAAAEFSNTDARYFVTSVTVQDAQEMPNHA